MHRFQRMAAPTDGEPCPETPRGSRRARREADAHGSTAPAQPARPSPYAPTEPSPGAGSRPSPYGSAAQPQRPSPYASSAPSPYAAEAPASRRDARRPEASTPAQARTRRPAGRTTVGDRIAARLDRRRNRRTLTFAQKTVGITATAAMVLTGAI